MGTFSDMPDSNSAALDAYEIATSKSVARWEAAEDEYTDEAVEELVSEILFADPNAVIQLDALLCDYCDYIEYTELAGALCGLYDFHQRKDMDAGQRGAKWLEKTVKKIVTDHFEDQVTDRIAKLAGYE